jgi:ketosteroid isomerase-like protein
MLFAPYHAIVRRIVRNAYATISAGKTQGFSRQFAPDAVFCFYGDHALGGELHGRPAIEAWFARVARLFPDFHVAPEHIVVNGGPWDTTVAARFTARATLPGGVSYRNQGMQFIRIRWGSIVEDRLYEDTAALATALHRIADAGRPEALQPPVTAVPA